MQWLLLFLIVGLKNKQINQQNIILWGLKFSTGLSAIRVSTDVIFQRGWCILNFSLLFCMWYLKFKECRTHKIRT